MCHKIWQQAQQHAPYTWLSMLLATISASVWSPYLHPQIMQRWFNREHMAFFAAPPSLAACFGCYALNLLNKNVITHPSGCPPAYA